MEAAGYGDPALHGLGGCSKVARAARPRSGEIPRHGHDAHATSENLEMRPLKTEEHDSYGGRKETSARLAAWNGYSQMRSDRT